MAATDDSDYEVSPGRRRNMQAIRSRDTASGLAVRRLLHAHGFRFRVNFPPVKGLRRTADIVFPRQHVAVFIDGCFWHSCPEHGHGVATNSGYWDPKLARNRQRDQETSDMLKANGWLPVRFWAHDDPHDIAGEVERLVRLKSRT